MSNTSNAHAAPVATGNGHQIVFKGDIADTRSLLVPLQGVGGFRWPTHGVIPPLFATVAQQLLDTRLTTPTAQNTSQSRYTQHIRQLAACGVLKRVPNKPEDGVVAKYFAVVKEVVRTTQGTETSPPTILDVVHARAIFDMRDANTQETLNLEILAATQIVKRLRSIKDWKQKGYHIVHGDAKNWYYQIGMSDSNIFLCTKEISGEANWWKLTVLPMGWQHSCFVGQAAFWWTVLFRFQSDDALGIDNSVFRLVNPPGSIELDGGGCIILIYDSVFIIAQKQRAEQWYARIKRNAGLLKVIMKYLTIEDANAHLIFAGIEIKTERHGISWRPDSSVLDRWRQSRDQLLGKTARALWRILGYLRFAQTIAGVQRRTLGRCVKTQSIIAKRIAEQGLSFDNEFEGAGEACQAAWELLLNNQLDVYRHHASHVHEHAPRDFIFMAVDATPWRIVVMQFEEGGWVNKVVKVYDEQKDIDLMESEAITLGVDIAEGRNCVILTDNTVASRSWFKGYSPSEKLDKIVAERQGPLQTVILGDTPSEENVADILTRPERVIRQTEVEQRGQDSTRRCERAMAQWVATGSTYCERNPTTAMEGI